MLRAEPLPIDHPDANIHPSFFLPANNESQALGSNNPGPAYDNRMLRGPADNSNTFGDFMMNDSGHHKALEILNKTKEGREKAQTIFGSGNFAGSSAAMGGAANHDDGVDDGEMDDQMFADMVHQDDDEEKGKGVAAPKQPGADQNEVITADSLESERNGMDALLDGA